MNFGFVPNRLKNQIKDILVHRRAAKDLPHTLTYESMLQSMSALSFQEKEALWLELRKQLAESSESIAYAERIFQQFSGLLLEHGGTLQGARILELGPGVNLAAGLFFTLAGAARYTAVDALAAFPERPVEFYRNVLEELRRRPQIVGRNSLSDADFASILSVENGVRWNSERVSYVTPVPAETMAFPEDGCDYVYSNASFEHFDHPDRVIRRIFPALRPGGLTAHAIDLRDHIDFKKPLEFLKVGPAEYRHASPYGTNRWRASDFEQAFSAAGFHILKFETVERHEISDAEYESFDTYFKTRYPRSILEVLTIFVIATKPSAS